MQPATRGRSAGGTQGRDSRLSAVGTRSLQSSGADSGWKKSFFLQVIYSFFSICFFQDGRPLAIVEAILVKFRREIVTPTARGRV